MLTPSEAAALVEDVERVRVDTRSVVGRYTWTWCAVWAVVFAGASALGPRAVWYWPVAVPTALAVTAILDVRWSWSRTVRRSDSRYWLLGGAITVLCFGGGAILPPEVAVAWVWIVLGLGFAGFALIEHHRMTAAALAGLSLLSLLAGAAIPDPELVYRLLGAVFAVATVWLAWWMRR